MTTEQELLPCPFCGNAPAWLGVMDGHLIVCKAKECLSRYPQSSEKEAITAWNTRKGSIPLSALDGMVEKVARVVHKVDALGDRIPFDSMSLIGVKQRQIYTYLAQAAINAIKEEAGKL